MKLLIIDDERPILDMLELSLSEDVSACFLLLIRSAKALTSEGKTPPTPVVSDGVLKGVEIRRVIRLRSLIVFAVLKGFNEEVKLKPA